MKTVLSISIGANDGNSGQGKPETYDTLLHPPQSAVITTKVNKIQKSSSVSITLGHSTI